MPKKGLQRKGAKYCPTPSIESNRVSDYYHHMHTLKAQDRHTLGLLPTHTLGSMQTHFLSQNCHGLRRRMLAVTGWQKCQKKCRKNWQNWGRAPSRAAAEPRPAASEPVTWIPKGCAELPHIGRFRKATVLQGPLRENLSLWAPYVNRHSHACRSVCCCRSAAVVVAGSLATGSAWTAASGRPGMLRWQELAPRTTWTPPLPAAQLPASRGQPTCSTVQASEGTAALPRTDNGITTCG